MGWDDVLKFMVALVSFFGGIFVLARYILDKNEATVNLRAQHERDIQGIKEKNADKIIDRLERELSSLKVSFAHMEKTFVSTLADVSNTSKQIETLAKELKEMRKSSEERLNNLERLIDLGRGNYMVKGSKQGDT